MPLYRQIVAPGSYVLENSQSYNYLTEKHLQIIWFEQKLLKNLYNSEGELIEIISPGIWNTGAGPDFLKAHLRMGKKEYKGDVEIHINPEGWYAHGHQLDARYNQVILHLAYTSSIHCEKIFKQDGQSVLSLPLYNCLKVKLEQLLKEIDIEIYPYKQFTQAGHCAENLFKALPILQVKEFFKSAALWRLEKKSDYLKFRASASSAQFILGLALALGYKHNAEAFSDLYESLSEYQYLSENELLAIGMGASGFFNGKHPKHWESSTVYQHLRDLWWHYQSEIPLQVNFRLDAVRPLNHPLRRLVYLVKILSSSSPKLLWDKMLRLWKSHFSWMQTEKHVLHLQKLLLDAIPVYSDNYWNSHFNFEKEPYSQHLSLMGEDLKREILINAFLPLLYANIQETAEVKELTAFSNLYAGFKFANTSKTRYLRQRFFNDSNQHLLKSAQIEQGAYQLHKDFCLQFESSCEGCPFVERMQSQQLIPNPRNKSINSSNLMGIF